MRLSRAQAILTTIILTATLFSCNGKNSKTVQQTANTENLKAVPFIEVATPQDGELVTKGDELPVSFTLPKEVSAADSIVVLLNGQKLSGANQPSLKITTADFAMGSQRLQLTAYKGGERVAEKYLTFYVKSAQTPVQYSYKVIKTYPHDTHAYTQGLTFDNNVLYEGTGQRGISELRVVNLGTGEVQKRIPLPDYIFGEGIAVLGNKIYQLSWQNQVGFIYDKSKFEKIGEFSYPGEGWGLTTDGRVLFLSDGSRVIRLLNPDNLREISRIEVYDNKGSVDYLNELEYINGEIWANIYLTDKIVRIDPKTGEVLGYINFSGILPQSDRDENTDVLNGIAYNPSDGKLYVTGKNWPKLFEVKVVKR